MKLKNKTALSALAAALVLSWGPAARAADNGTEFGIADDLTVLGVEGLTTADPDVEIKGFTVFGATEPDHALNIPKAAGNIYANGYVQVSSGMYVVGGSTFAAGGAYFTGVSSFSNVGSIYIPGANDTTKVLKSNLDGSLVWGADATGGFTPGTQNWIPMYNGGGLAASKLMQDPGNLSVTLTASSMTVQGNGTDGLGVSGATKLNGNTSITGANTFTVGTGLTSLGGALNVAGTSTIVSSETVKGDIMLGADNTKFLTVNAQSSFVGGSTFTTGGAYFTGVSSFSDVSKVFYGGGGANQVLKKVAGAGMAWGDDNTGLTTIGNAYWLQMVNAAGTGLANSAFLQNAGATNITMVAASSMTVLGAFGAGGAATLGNNLTVSGNAQIGDAVTDTHGVNMAPVAAQALAVKGNTNPGDYAAVLYSGTSMSAWLKKK